METGINFEKQEESYTSKASYMFGDAMPVYGEKDVGKAIFSGKRAPKRYRGQYRAGGFRGLYKNKDGSIVNSDLNGSANIGRKKYPELFKPDSVDFNNVIILKHPDELKVTPLGIGQRDIASKGMSKV